MRYKEVPMLENMDASYDAQMEEAKDMLLRAAFILNDAQARISRIKVSIAHEEAAVAAQGRRAA